MTVLRFLRRARNSTIFRTPHPSEKRRLAFSRWSNRKLHSRAPPVRTGPVGQTITLQVPLAPGQSCQAEHGGTFWTVLNDSPSPIPSGSQARIESVQGLVLLVRP